MKFFSSNCCELDFLKIWLAFLNSLYFIHCDENSSSDENLSFEEILWLKFNPVMKINHCDENLSLWWNFIMVITFISTLKIYWNNTFIIDDLWTLMFLMKTWYCDEKLSLWLSLLLWWKCFCSDEIDLFELLSIGGFI